MQNRDLPCLTNYKNGIGKSGLSDNSSAVGYDPYKNPMNTTSNG